MFLRLLLLPKWDLPESNQRRYALQAYALPTKLRPHCLVWGTSAGGIRRINLRERKDTKWSFPRKWEVDTWGFEPQPYRLWADCSASWTKCPWTGIQRYKYNLSHSENRFASVQESVTPRFPYYIVSMAFYSLWGLPAILSHQPVAIRQLRIRRFELLWFPGGF